MYEYIGAKILRFMFYMGFRSGLPIYSLLLKSVYSFIHTYVIRLHKLRKFLVGFPVCNIIINIMIILVYMENIAFRTVDLCQFWSWKFSYTFLWLVSLLKIFWYDKLNVNIISNEVLVRSDDGSSFSFVFSKSVYDYLF